MNMTFMRCIKCSRALGLVLFMLVLLVQQALAQSAPASAAQAERQEARQESDEFVVVPAGTELIVYLTEALQSNIVVEGDAVYFKVAQDVSVGGHVVIAKDTMAEGYVFRTRTGKEFGVPGKLRLEIGSTSAVDGQTVKLRGSYAKRGPFNPAALGGLYLLLGPLGPGLYHGKSARIEAGTKFKVFTENEKRVRVNPSKGQS